MPKITVKPYRLEPIGGHAYALHVPNPDTNTWLKPEGEEVEDSSYWRRRLDDGDVIQVVGKPHSKKS